MGAFFSRSLRGCDTLILRKVSVAEHVEGVFVNIG
ncbi:hypothetical protein DEVEQU_00472 [Devosia equisanguinis]|uniref:Uncharacterized protein n=1 Tax=Devosia equisanguinis TaxID=2490941 RepID=A0A447I740_9HYPH|nr:hypothetical protein DEVEQU_00472 [Devosia equisanguinis]